LPIIGATGNAGKRITEEALSRGYRLPQIARNINGTAPKNNLALKVGDINNPYPLAKCSKVMICYQQVKYTDYDHDQPHQSNTLIGCETISCCWWRQLA